MDLENGSVDEKYDVIYTLMTMHHVQDVKKVIEEFAKILLPGGMLIIGDLEKEDGDFHSYPENQEVHFGFEKQFLETIISENNMRLTDYKIFYEIEKQNEGSVKKYPLFILFALNV